LIVLMILLQNLYAFFMRRVMQWQPVNPVPWRSAVFKRQKSLLVTLVMASLFATGAVAVPVIAGQQAATPKAHDNVARGEAEATQLLLLMEPDKDGKVSKQEFMSFMEAEFDRLDKKKEGKLDVKELTRARPTPSGVLGRQILFEPVPNNSSPGGTMLSVLLIAILAVGLPFFLVCIRGFLKDLKRYRNK
jgi:hypothetical protein